MSYIDIEARVVMCARDPGLDVSLMYATKCSVKLFGPDGYFYNDPAIITGERKDMKTPSTSYDRKP